MEITKYSEKDLKVMINIWNDVVTEGEAFPQKELLDLNTGRKFFKSMTYTGVAKVNGRTVGLYILHPNNIGRVGTISNASYAVDKNMRGEHIGEKIVMDSLCMAKKFGFRIMQFNAVVENNIHAIHLYERIGFQKLGTIPHCFENKSGEYDNICLYYYDLMNLKDGEQN